MSVLSVISVNPALNPLVCGCLNCLRHFHDSRRFCESHRVLRVRRSGIEWKMGQSITWAMQCPKNGNCPRPETGRKGPKMSKWEFGSFFPSSAIFGVIFSPISGWLWAILHFSAIFSPFANRVARHRLANHSYRNVRL